MRYCNQLCFVQFWDSFVLVSNSFWPNNSKNTIIWIKQMCMHICAALQELSHRCCMLSSDLQSLMASRLCRAESWAGLWLWSLLTLLSDLHCSPDADTDLLMSRPFSDQHCWYNSLLSWKQWTFPLLLYVLIIHSLRDKWAHLKQQSGWSQTKVQMPADRPAWTAAWIMAFILLCKDC